MRRWRTTLIVAGIFVVLLLYVALFEARREPSSGGGAIAPLSAPGFASASPTPASVLAIATDDVRALHITAGDRTLTLVQQGEKWVVAPIGAGTTSEASSEGAPADTSIYWSIDEILQLDARLVVAEGAADLAQYGLDHPAMTITIETLSGASEQLFVGRQAPGGTAFYLQRAGDPQLYIVDHYKIQTLYDWLADPPYAPTPGP
jgi:hypothetical protein